jgi:hypothetical protein
MSSAPAKRACRILLVRHAVAEGNGRFQGQTDVPLATAAGPQLRMLVRKISRYRIQAIYSSDRWRAHATAKVVARTFATEVVVRPGLREIHFGRWEGLSWRQIARRFPRLSRVWLTHFPHHPIPGAEPFDAFKRRVTCELDNRDRSFRELCRHRSARGCGTTDSGGRPRCSGAKSVSNGVGSGLLECDRLLSGRRDHPTCERVILDRVMITSPSRRPCGSEGANAAR